MSFRLGANDSNHCTGAWRNLFFVRWRQETLPSVVHPMRRFIRALIKEYPEGIGMVAIVEAQAAPPSAEARRAISTLFESVSDGVVASAVVFEGAGFRASFVRSVATGLTLIAKQPFPHRVFASVEEAAPWLSEQLPVTEFGRSTPREICEASHFIRKTSIHPAAIDPVPQEG